MPRLPQNLFFLFLFFFVELFAHTRCCCLSITVTLLLDRSHSFIDLAGLSVSLVYLSLVYRLSVSLVCSHTLVVVVVYPSQSHSFLIDLAGLSISPFVLYPSSSFNNIQWRQKVSFPLLSLVLIIVCQSRRIGKKPLRTIFPGTTTSTTTPYTAKQ